MIRQRSIIGITEKTCMRCGHKWMPRQTLQPIICPECNSPYWNVPKKSAIIKPTPEFKLRPNPELRPKPVYPHPCRACMETFPTIEMRDGHEQTWHHMSRA